MAVKTSPKKGLTYAQVGVDIAAGDRVVELIKGHLKRTYGPRVLGAHGGFAGCFRLDFNEKLFQRNYRDPVLIACTDSVGTKALLAATMGVHDTIGQDCVAMNVNDLIVQGAEPLFFLDYVGIHKALPDQIQAIVAGVADGCERAGCALIGGETCEMPEVYKPGDYDLVGFALGVSELNRMVDGQRVEEGDLVLGMASSGVHANGYTLVRTIVRQAGLDLDKVYPELNDARPLGQLLLEPTRIYARQIVAVLRQYKVKKVINGMAHITGGGLGGNVNRALPSDLNARISRKAWSVPPVFDFLQKHGEVDDEEMFRVFNMGIGFVLIIRPHFCGAIAARLKRCGQRVFLLGRITPGTGRLVLT